jgi:hypothetical protein
MLIIRTSPTPKDTAEHPGSGPMLQDTVAGKVYTHRRPFLVEMNSFIESYLNKQVISLHGEASRTRPAQLAIVVNSEDCERLKDGVSDKDLEIAWNDFLKKGRAEDPRFEEKLTADEWKEFSLSWVRANSGGRKAHDKDEGGQKNPGGEGNQGQPGGNRPPRNAA